MNNKNLPIFILTSLLLIFCCCQPSVGKKKDENKPLNAKELILVFFKNPLLKEYKKNSFFTANKIMYYDDRLSLIEVNLNNRSKNDTIKLSARHDYIPLDLFMNYIVYNYHFKTGDTIFFRFQNDIPIAQSKTDSTDYDLNYSLEYKKRFGKPLKGNNLLTMSRDVLSTAAKFHNINKTYLNQQYFLDSLLNIHRITPEVAKFYKNQNDFEFYSQAIIYPSFIPHFNKTTDDFDPGKLVNAKKYFSNGYFHQFLYWKYLGSPELNIKRVRHSQGISLDYKQAYEESKKRFQEKELREAMLLYCLQSIKQEESIAVFKAYQNKFKSDVSEDFYEIYRSENQLVQIETKAGSSLLIGRSKNKKIEFSQMLKSLSGNVIYIDLWASWCVPCRAAMPDSHKLKEMFKGKPVSFIYLSLDEKYDNWVKASVDEGLSADSNSFLLINPKEAALTKLINLKSIPRYLIYNKKGDLIHQNAPGPGSEEVKKLIQKSLE